MSDSMALKLGYVMKIMESIANKEDLETTTELFTKGNELHNLGKYSEAIECYDKALEINPNLAGVWREKGVALHKLGRYSEAIKCFDRALKLYPDLADAWKGKGLALEKLGKYSEAEQCFDMANRLYSKNKK
jgi:tetratricopeptide (TPR) repeat protein